MREIILGKCRESNPGQLAEKRERYLCAFLTHPIKDENVSGFGLGVVGVVALDLDLAVLPQPAVVLQLDAGWQRPVGDTRLK